VPYDAELECKVHVIVYDGNTRSLREKSKKMHMIKLLFYMREKSKKMHMIKLLFYMFFFYKHMKFQNQARLYRAIYDFESHVNLANA